MRNIMGKLRAVSGALLNAGLAPTRSKGRHSAQHLGHKSIPSYRLAFQGGTGIHGELAYYLV